MVDKNNIQSFINEEREVEINYGEVMIVPFEI